MLRSFAFYKLYVTIVSVLFVTLVVIQIIWLNNTVTIQQNQMRQELKGIVPDIALEVNAIDHIMFRKSNIGNAELPYSEIDSTVNRVLTDRGINYNVCFAIFQDTTTGVFLSNRTDLRYNLKNSDIKACISDIISFSYADTTYLDANGRSSYSYFRPVDNISGNSSSNVWLSLYIPDALTQSVKGVVLQFIFSMMLIIMLLILIIYLIRLFVNTKLLSNAKADFFNNMSHEFKVPLASVRLASKMLKSTDSPGKKLIYHDIIDKESRRLEYQVNRLLELSVFDKEGYTSSMSSFNFSEMLRAIDICLKPIVDKHKATLTVTDKLSELVIEGDREHLYNSICNLVENSLKYGGGGVNVNITAIHSDDKITVAVSDNGPGIAPEYRDRIFERFFRAKRENEYRTGGFGLGLNYVKTVIEAHGGVIKLDDNYNTGCRFIIEI
jgi:signal transduction histidine kinase